MDTQLTPTEIRQIHQLVQNYESAQAALTALDHNNGRLDTSFHQLWQAQVGRQTFGEGKSLWQTTLKVLRRELCGDESFRSKILDYNKNPGSASLLTGAVLYIIELTALPLSPALATIVVLYILKVGLNIFCEYTEPSTNSPAQ